MPTIPQYERRQQLTTQPGAVKKSESFAGRQGQAISQLGQVMGQVAERMQRVERVRQLNEAKLKISKWRNRIRFQSTTNPQEWSLERFDKEARDFKNKVLGDIKDPQLRNEFRVKLQQDLGATKLRVFNNVEKYRLKETLATGLDTVEELAEDYAAEPNKKSRNQKKQEINNIIGDITAAGAIDAVQAKKIKDSLFKDLGVRRAEQDLSSKGVDRALINLMDGDYNVNQEQKKDLRTKFLKIQKKEEEKAEIELDKRKTQEGIVLIERFISDENVLNDAENMKKSSDVYSDVADALITAETSAKSLKAETKGKIYTDLARRALSLGPDDTEKARKVMIDGLNAVAEGNLEKMHFGEIVELNKKAFRLGAEPSLLDSINLKYDQLNGYFDKHFPYEKSKKMSYKAIQSFFNKILNEDKPPADAKEESIGEIIEGTYKGYSRADLEYTAEEMNMTIDEVVKALEAREE